MTKELPFSPGDIVTCVDQEGVDHIVNGRPYTVKDCWMGTDEPLVNVDEVTFGFYAHRFKLKKAVNQLEDTRSYLESITCLSI